jgi:2-iminobutanoate/2-iminopropanoate deaminase
MTQRRTIKSPAAPAAIGPYSQAVACGNWVFLSGQIPLHPHTGVLVTANAETATEQLMRNLEAVLHDAGLTFDHVVKTTIYLVDLGDFAAVNRVYAKYFAENPPARATVQVAALPKGALVEIDAIAFAAGPKNSGT